MRFDAAALATAWLSVAQASGTDSILPTLNRTVAIEQYDGGVRLVSTDRYILLTAWVPDLDTADDAPGIDEAPIRTVVTQDVDQRGKGLLKYLLKVTRWGKDDETAYGSVHVSIQFDVRLPIDPDEDQPLEGMEPTYAVLDVPDVERVYLPVIEDDYPSWRTLLDGFTGHATDTIGLPLDRLYRLGGLRAWAHGPLAWTFGGPDKPARVTTPTYDERDPAVDGIVMPARWVMIGENDDKTDDEDDPDQTTVDDALANLTAEGVTVTVNGDGPMAEALRDHLDTPDELVNQVVTAAQHIVTAQFASPAMLQRKMRIGHGRATDLVATLEDLGVVSSPTTNGSRDVLVRADALDDLTPRLRAVLEASE